MYRHISYLFPCMEESTLPLLVAVGLRHSFSMDILGDGVQCQLCSSVRVTGLISGTFKLS